MILNTKRRSDARGGLQFETVPLAIVEGESEGFESFVPANRERGRRVKAAAQQDDGAFHFASGYWARTVNAIPPRAENSAVTMASRGEQARTKSSRIRLVTASLKARSFR